MSDAVTETHDHAAARYKELAARATAAVDSMTEHERSLADELEDGLAASKERIDEALRQEEQVTEGVRIRWNAAMEALWDERWMRVTSRPAPDPSASPASPDECIRKVQAAYLELHAALGRSRPTVPSWLPKPGRRREAPED